MKNYSLPLPLFVPCGRGFPITIFPHFAKTERLEQPGYGHS